MLILVALTAGGFLLQGIALLMIARRFKAAATRRQKVLDDLERRADQLMAQAGLLFDSLKPLSVAAKSVSENVSEMVEIARRRTDEIDSFLQEVTEAVRCQAGKVDYIVTDTVQKFEQISSTIQRDILAPAMEIASIVRGIRTGFDYLFSRKRSTHLRPVSQDEEMFI